MKILRKWHVSLDFSNKILINSLASGVRPWDPYKCIFLTFSKFLPNFSRKIRENFKTFWKFAKISMKIIKNWNFWLKIVKFHCFFKFWKLLLRLGGGGSTPGPPTRRPPYKLSFGGPLFHHPRKIPEDDNGFMNSFQNRIPKRTFSRHSWG